MTSAQGQVGVPNAVDGVVNPVGGGVVIPRAGRRLIEAGGSDGPLRIQGNVGGDAEGIARIVSCAATACLRVPIEKLVAGPRDGSQPQHRHD